MERYYSFHELAAGKWEKEPKWYSDAARWLVRNQEDDGSWGSKMDRTKSPIPVVADTSFATLFLLRSSKKSIEKAFGFGESVLIFGRGLPRDTAKVALLGGKVVAAVDTKTAGYALPLLEKDGGPDFEKGLEALGQLPADEIRRLRAGDADLFGAWPRTSRRRSGSSPSARSAAAATSTSSPC